MTLIGYGIENNNLVEGIGMKFASLPVHAYIPMRDDGVRLTPIEAIAYRNQLRAKRVCDKQRKRDQRRNPKYKCRYRVMGVTVK